MRQLSGNTFLSRLLFNQKLFQFSQLLRNYTRHLSFDFLFLHGDANLRHSTTTSGLFYLILAPFLLLGLIQLWIKHRPLFFLLTLWWLAALLPASVPLTSVPHALRTLNALVPSALIIAFGVAYWLAHSRSLPLRAIFGLCLVGSVTGFSWYYLTIYPATSAPAFQADYPKHIQLLTQNQGSYANIYTLGTNENLYLWYLLLPTTDLTHLPPATDFKFPSVDNIRFQTLPPDALTSPYLIYAPASRLEEFFTTLHSPYTIVNSYLATDGTLFLATRVEPML
jgi:hypothetical protein